MPDLFDLFSRWWKQMLTVIILAMLVTGVLYYFKPVRYQSAATAVPGSSFLSDKSAVFNDNIEQLYSTLGTPDDLDAVVGIAALDTVYLSVAASLPLPAHYKVKEQGAAGVMKAAYCLKKNSKVYKSEYGNLKIKVWDADKDMAPQLANAITEKLQAMYQDIQNVSNKTILEGLIRSRYQLQLQIDSAYESPDAKSKLMQEVVQYNNKITEYKMVIENKPPSLIVVEKARPAAWPDRSPLISVLLAAGVLAFLFSLLLALVMEKRKNRPV